VKGIADGLEAGDNLERYPSQVRETLETAQENTSEALEQQQEQLKQGSNTVDQNLDANNQPDLLGTELGTIQVIDITIKSFRINEETQLALEERPVFRIRELGVIK